MVEEFDGKEVVLLEPATTGPNEKLPLGAKSLFYDGPSLNYPDC